MFSLLIFKGKKLSTYIGIITNTIIFIYIFPLGPKYEELLNKLKNEDFSGSANFKRKYFENRAKAPARGPGGIHADTPCPARKHNFRRQIENFYREKFDRAAFSFFKSATINLIVKIV